jgi:5-methylcytosine-specific restriction endonuclease McrA
MFEGMPKTRKEARSLQAKHYFTGEPCILGHVVLRQASSGTCMECDKNRTAEKRRENWEEFKKSRQIYYEKNKDRINSINRKRYAETVEHRREWARAYKEANREKFIEKNRAWREANKDKIKVWSRESYERNIEARVAAEQARREIDRKSYNEIVRNRRAKAPEKHRESALLCAHKRRAQKLNAGGEFTREDIAALRVWQMDACAICGSGLRGKGHVDHIVALSRGGSNEPRNLQLLCQSCNCRKHAAPQIKFVQRRFSHILPAWL